MGTLARALDSDVMHSFRTSPVAMVSALIAAVCILGAAFSHWLAPHDPFDLASLSLMDSFKPPAFSAPVGGVDGDWSFPLGTDDQGRDVLSGIMYGARI
ncbi:MAG: ABC transporter permease, partial [Proteobacteria bacterium]|nr:ABC transporter permease [Pseudomonadota bacterium]